MTSFLSKTSPLRDHLLNIAFIGIHLGCLLAFISGVSPIAVAVCIALYIVRMFGLTAGYHRYFSHRTFKTSRVFQFILGALGASSLQNGPLWWAAHHRHHHRHSDTEEDLHSPVVNSFYWAHCGWILSKKYSAYNQKEVRDLAKYPEVVWLQRYFIGVALTMVAFLFIGGTLLDIYAPSLGTNGFQMVVWGGFISTTILYHGTFTINSLAHKMGRRRFKTTDDSRNSFILAIITLGEGWHNNHHRFLASERQGFYWWEIDITHYILTALSWIGVVWDLKAPPHSIYAEAERNREERRVHRRRVLADVAEDAAAIPQAILEPQAMAEQEG